MSNIALGPDGNVWFPIGYGKNTDENDEGVSAAIGRITAVGKIKMFGIPFEQDRKGLTTALTLTLPPISSPARTASSGTRVRSKVSTESPGFRRRESSGRSFRSAAS